MTWAAFVRPLRTWPGEPRTFEALAETYDQHVGRYTPSLARAHVRLLDIHRRNDVLEVGCGPGALTGALAQEVGGQHVCAVDPSEPFVEECRRRVPDADVRVAAAEDLPDFQREFAAATSQLVVNFMSDADAGVASMRRVVKAGGVVASVVWDYRAGMRMLRVFWDAALELDRNAPDEGRTMPHLHSGWAARALAARWPRPRPDGRGRGRGAVCGLRGLLGAVPTGIAPSGAYCASLDEEHREALRELVFRHLGAPEGPFVLNARAWYVRGTVRGPR